MKLNTFLLVFSLLIFGNLSYSQTIPYQPFPEQYGKSWVLTTYFSGGYEAPKNDYNRVIYAITGDTIIGNYLYKKVTKSREQFYEVYFNEAPEIISFEPYEFAFAFRNDTLNKKVYIYTEIYTSDVNFPTIFKDTLWYDFNLSVGDTLKTMYSFGSSEQLVVMSIDTLLNCNQYHKKYNLYAAGDPGNYGRGHVDLTEGIGFPRSFIQSDYNNFIGFESSRDCYTNQICEPLSIPENALEKFKIYPNPVLKEITIETDHTIIKDYSIFDCFGNLRLYGRITGKNRIDVSKLEMGMYILKVSDSNNNVSNAKFIKQ